MRRKANGDWPAADRWLARPALAAAAFATVLLVPTHALAQVELVKDIYPGKTTEAYLSPRDIVGSNGRTLFVAATSSMLGPSLWRTDGTPEGPTWIWGGERAYWYHGPSELTDVDGTVYFVNRDLAHGDELWRVDRGYLFADGFESADVTAWSPPTE